MAFNPLAGVVIAVDLGATHATVAVADLAANILTSHTHPLDIADGPERVLDSVIAEGAGLLERQGIAPTQVVGVGIGVPGPVEHSTGRPTNPPIMPGWDRFDVPHYVQRTFDVPYDSIYDPGSKTLLDFPQRYYPRWTPTTVVLDTQGRVAALIPGARLEVLSGVGHMFWWEQPVVSAQLVRSHALVGSA